MGTSHSIAELTGKLNAAGEGLREGSRSALYAAADRGGAVMLNAALAARTKGITIRKTRFAVGEGDGVNVRYGPNPGWVHIMNDRTQPHFIARGGRGTGSLRRQNIMGSRVLAGRSSRRGRALAGRLLAGAPVGAGSKGAINIKGVGPRAYAFHPGTRGKHFAMRGIRAAEPAAIDTYQRRQVANFARPFR